MKLRAVRLSEVGHFRSGVALEGLSGALDVVPGPNEMGKSTIFRAIETVFQTPYTGTAAAVQELAPMQGGAPLIEVEFELGGTRWRLRKRYLAQKLAELVDLDRKTLLRGADAENRLADLVAGRLGRKRMLDLLWVRQRHGLELPKDDRNGDIAKSLGRLIEDEIADAAGDGLARRVREAVAKALDGLVSKATRKPSAGKPYKAAIDVRDQAQAAFDHAASAAQAADQRLAEMKTAQAEADTLASPEALAARAATLVNLLKSRDDATRAAQALANATLVVEAKQAARDQAAGRLQLLTSGIADVERLRAEGAATAAALAQATHDVEHCGGEAEALQVRQAEVRQRGADLQGQLDAHERFDRQRAFKSKQEDLVRRLAVARTASVRIAEIDAALAAEPVTEVIAADLRRARSDIERLQAQLSASLPKVRIDYAAGGEGRIRVAGDRVAGSGEIEQAPTLMLDIEGIGRLTIAAPGAAAGDLAAALDAARRSFETRLAAVLARNLDEVDGRLARRQQINAERQAESARLAAEAPMGVAGLERDLSAHAVNAEPVGNVLAAPPLPRSQIAGDLAASRAAMAQIESAERAGQSALLEASKRHARLVSEQASLAARLGQVEATLPQPSEYSTELGKCREIAAGTEADLNTVVLERAAWSAGVLAPAALATVKADIAAASTEDDRIKARRHQIALEIARLESALVRDRQDGVVAVLEDARAALEVAEARVAAFQREVAELELLERLLAAQAEAARASELKPVVDRLQLYAHGVFPEARFELGDVLAVSGLTRQGANLSGNRLSGGTSEQIAVLVRLAYARLLADRGEALPLVLDDALVYADAGRFGAMFAALEAASQHHQVIMLTCHAERVAALGARSNARLIELRTWTPAETALAG